MYKFPHAHDKKTFLKYSFSKKKKKLLCRIFSTLRYGEISIFKAFVPLNQIHIFPIPAYWLFVCL